MVDAPTNTVELAAELTAAWLGNTNTRVSANDVPAFLKSMHDTLAGLSADAAPATPEEAAPAFTPAGTARKSLASPDHIVSMIDGKPYRTLRRHLSGHGLTPEQYRARYGLKSDYPMVAPSYSEARRAMAKVIGLGRKPKAPEPAPEPEPKKRGRKSATAAKAAAQAHLGGGSGSPPSS